MTPPARPPAPTAEDVGAAARAFAEAVDISGLRLSPISSPRSSRQSRRSHSSSSPDSPAPGRPSLRCGSASGSAAISRVGRVRW